MSLLHLPSRGRIPGVSANSRACQLLFGEKGCGSNWPFLKASHGGLNSSARGVQKQCLEVTAATEILHITVRFLQFKELPTPLSNQGTEVDYTLLGLLDCHQEEDKRGTLSYFFTLVKFQMKTKEIEESSGDYIRVVNTLPNITSNS